MSHPDRPIPPHARERVAFRSALFLDQLLHDVPRISVMNLMKVSYQFNEMGYRDGDWKSWAGKILIVTSEDDPEYKDVPLLQENLPGTRVEKLSPGFRHLAPAVEHDRFYGILTDFLKGLKPR